MFKYLGIILLLTACTAEVENPITETESVTKVEQAACVFGGTRYLTIGVNSVTGTEECGGVAFYAAMEPQRLRIDNNSSGAPPPKKPNGESCSWLSPLVNDTSTPLDCDFIRSFTCPYPNGPMIYHMFIAPGYGTSEPSALKLKMYISEPGGYLWDGCVRTVIGRLRFE